MITSDKIKTVQDKIKEAIKQIEKEENVKVSFGSCRYDASEYKSTMKVVTTAKDESTSKAVESVNERLSKSYGFKSNIVGKSFTLNGMSLKIVEFKTRNRKFPIISETSDGRRYKHTTSQIQNKIK